MVCDTCGTIGPTEWVRSWRCCAICVKFVERGDRDGLAVRALIEFERLQLATEMPSCVLLQMITDIHDELFVEVAS